MVLLSSAAEETTPAPGIRNVRLDADGVPLSGLCALPAQCPPRAVLVALHGGGMRAGYFHSGLDPGASLLALASACGHAVLAPDRPGYGASRDALPEGMGLEEQAALIRTAVTACADRHAPGTGVFLVGHSFGGKVALAIAADWDGPGLLGVDVSGVGDRWAVAHDRLADAGGRRASDLHWGPLRRYPSGTFRHAQRLFTPLPPREFAEAAHWPERYPAIARSVRVPVRLTFAEYERWWRCDTEAVNGMAGRLAAPVVRHEHLAGAGHNISLGYAARAYHLRVLAFAEECLMRATCLGEGGRPARSPAHDHDRPPAPGDGRPRS